MNRCGEWWAGSQLCVPLTYNDLAAKDTLQSSIRTLLPTGPLDDGLFVTISLDVAPPGVVPMTLNDKLFPSIHTSNIQR